MKTAYYNGFIYNEDKSYSTLMIVDDNVIDYIGNDSSRMENIEAKTDLCGQYVFPGFNDSHMHFLGLGYNKTITNLSKAKNIDEIISTLQINKDDFIVGRGWNQENLKEKRMPTKEELDLVSTDKPIIIIRVCGHVAVCNSKTLEIANISQDSKQIEGGTFDFESGLFTEDALQVIYSQIPSVNQDQLKRMFKMAEKDLLANGVTSIQSDDFSTLQVDFEDVMDVLNNLYQNQELEIRLSEQVNLPTMENLTRYLNSNKRNKVSHLFDYGILKLLADGSLGGRTAYLRAPYSDDLSTSGVPIFTQEQLDMLILNAHKNGLDVGIHSIGDATCEMILSAIEKALSQYPREHRHGIIHAQIIDKVLIQRLKALGVGVYVQPIFLNSDNNIVESRLGKRAQESYLFKTMYQEGIITSLGTDAPVETFNPFHNLYCAVTRKSIDGPNYDAFLPEEGMTIHEAIECYTLHSALMMKKENLGILKQNYLADFIVVNNDIINNVATLLEAKVLSTYVNGKCVYKEK